MLGAVSFIHPDFLLETAAARRLYHDFAASEPILDYHCHLPPHDLAGNRRFANLFEIWLEGDHYKWRAMRANGVAERYCTGDASPYEKFLAFARTVPQTLRNPLYHWTHLELARYFGITDLLNEDSAEKIWNQANEQLAGELTAWGIARKFDVRAVCTTDDPIDTLEHHYAFAENPDRAEFLRTKMYPTFRPDKALTVHQPEAFNAWTAKLSAAANVEIDSFAKFCDAIARRHAAFASIGGRLSDHGLNHCFGAPCPEATAKAIFDRARAGQAASPDEHRQFASYLMFYFGQLDARAGFTKQLHLGALRAANSRALATIGPDTGFDSIGDWPQMEGLRDYLDALEQDGSLPKMVIYNLNPADNYAVATMVGNFQDGKIAGKMQFGSGWWFLDQKEAMEWQMNALSNCGLFSRFVGMLTDSRSFMSYPRHEYFRRTLCNLVGREMEIGLIPNDFALVGGMVRRICFANAQDFFGLTL